MLVKLHEIETSQGSEPNLRGNLAQQAVQVAPLHALCHQHRVQMLHKDAAQRRTASMRNDHSVLVMTTMMIAVALTVEVRALKDRNMIATAHVVLHGFIICDAGCSDDSKTPSACQLSCSLASQACLACITHSCSPAVCLSWL